MEARLEDLLKDRTVLLGVSGGIAAYKAAELCRDLVKIGAKVHVVMTRNAREFVGPLTFSSLTGNRAITGMFESPVQWEIDHIALTDRADAFAVAPATANILAKGAAGIADDMLSTMILAARVPVLFAPAMNVRMYGNPSTQANLARLRAHGHRIVAPGSGELACGAEGVGRLAPLPDILDGVRSLLCPQDLTGQVVLVTAGPTEEVIDPVRFVTNRSSGKMGLALARAAAMRGAEVILVHGPIALDVPASVRSVPVRSAAQMHDAVIHELPEATVVIKAAAVADFRPSEPKSQKIKKGSGGESPSIALERTEDILEAIGRCKGDRVLVGFAAETRDLLDNARAKLRKKNCDLMVANDVSRPDAGFAVDTNIVTLIDASGGVDRLEPLSKLTVAHRVLDRVAGMLGDGSDLEGRPGTEAQGDRS